MEENDLEFDIRVYPAAYRSGPLRKFLQVHGKQMSGSSLSSAVNGLKKDCFRSASDAALMKGLDYWEDHAWRQGSGIMPIHHAWCVDSSTGVVFDPTWGESPEAMYLGVHVPNSLLSGILENSETYGVLDKGQGFVKATARRLWGWCG